jgi:hypothetical protein
MPEITNFTKLRVLLAIGGHSPCQEFQVMKLSYFLPFSQAAANGICGDQVKSVPRSLLSVDVTCGPFPLVFPINLFLL